MDSSKNGSSSINTLIKGLKKLSKNKSTTKIKKRSLLPNLKNSKSQKNITINTTSTKFTNLKTKLLSGKNETINENRYTTVEDFKNFPKNTNLYKHLYDNKLFSNSDLMWTLDLRSEIETKSMEKINKFTVTAPSFYEQDLNKIKTLNKKKFLPDYILNGNNSYVFNHIIHPKNTNLLPNKSQLNFETSLRNFGKNKKNEDGIEKYNKWNKSCVKILGEGTFLPPVTEKTKDKFNGIKKFIPKIYQISYSNIEYNGEKILKKKLIENVNEIPGISSDHLNKPPYQENYRTKNIQSIYHLMNSNSNPTLSFETSLRSFGKENFCRYTSHRNIRHPKKKISENYKNNIIKEK